MVHDSSRPEYLFSLAKGGSERDRETLALSIASFLSAGLSDASRVLAKDILLQLLKEAEKDLRLTLARHLANEPDCPKELLRYLIFENPLEISSPVLRYSEALEDTDLLEVAAHFAQRDYWQEIAQRNKIGEEVTDFLVGTRDIPVCKLLVNNQGACLSKASVEWLINVSPYLKDIQKPLLQRAEITPQLASKLYWYVSDELKAFITSNFKVDQTQINALLDKIVKNYINDQKPGRTITSEMQDLACHLKRQNKITAKTITSCFKKGNLAFCACLWGALLNLRPEMLLKKWDEDFSETMAILVRVSHFMRSDYNLLFLHAPQRKSQMVTNHEELNLALRKFDLLDFETAYNVMRGWHDERGASKTIH